MIRKSLSEPSSSLNLKEVLTEKIPVYYDLLRDFRREHGTAVVNKITVNDMYSGLSGMKTIIKETSDSHPKFGVTYRGVTMPGIVNLLPHRGHFPSPESIFWLLLTGDVPTESQTRSLIHDWASRRQKRNNWLSECQTILKVLPQRLGPLEKLSIILMSLDSTDKHVKDSLRSKILSHEQWECQNFQEKIQRLLGPNPQTNILKGLVRAFIEKSNNSLPGYEKSNYPNLGYHVLHMFANEIASQDPQVKLSMKITNVVDSIPQANEEHFVPEKNSIICPLLKYYGLNDMEFNQGLICMSRALGAVASIIWSRIINLPVENPLSCSTHHCIELMKKTNRESRHDKVILIPKK
ncbi:hypothetical protein PV327_006561 [Microctonus hyperodae]|uniref:Citrate synthase n=1 Tax=Microctonus hyperodae TaxID=165561 RepID=A0AA39F4J3_MICHY|nr:hypothetical protein PV327_006561 [Microctonus hyperodae]